MLDVETEKTLKLTTVFLIQNLIVSIYYNVL